VNKGKRAVPMFREHMLMFFALQCLYPLIGALLYASAGILAYASFAAWFIVSYLIFYRYALSKDTQKRHRHNGIPIGYEYPHPVSVSYDESKLGHGQPGIRMTRIINAGSKGIYDLAMKSEPNPHAMVIGESGLGKSRCSGGNKTHRNLSYSAPSGPIS